MGMNRAVALALAGSIAANGGTTDAAALLAETREALIAYYRSLYYDDIVDNPENYENWIILNGEPFDTSTMDD
jgi:hypothetical protein